MLLEVLTEIVKWIFSHFWIFNDVQILSVTFVDLHERNCQKRQEKLDGIHERLEHLSPDGWQIAEPCMDTRDLPQTQGKREKTNFVVQSNQNHKETKFPFEILQCKAIQHLDTAAVFRGQINEDSFVTIKKFAIQIDFDHEVKIFQALKTNEHFPKCFIQFKISRCLIFEIYEPLPEFKGQIFVQDVVVQISEGLKFLHEQEITHGDLTKENIAVLQQDCLKFKITNFSRKSAINQKINKSVDIFKFGCLIKLFYEESNEDHDVHESHLWVDLVDKMTCGVICIRPTIIEVKDHPYFFNAKMSLDFVVELCKLLEDSDNAQLYWKLRKSSLKICDKDWTSRVDKKVHDELNRIKSNFGGNKIDTNIIGLVKTMRNLVRKCLVLVNCHNSLSLLS